MPFQCAKKRVIVVDDDSGMRRALRMLLERRGYAVEECATGDELLCNLESKAGCPCCVILDLHLEGLSGLETRRRMGETKCPVILITGDTKAGGNLEPGLFQAVLYKPLDWLELCSKLQAFEVVA